MEQRRAFEYSSAPKCGFYLVGLVDILGQQRKLAELDKVSVDHPDKFAEQFIKNWRAIQRLRSAFQSTCESFLSQRKSDTKNKQLTGIEKDIYEYFLNPPEIKFQGFSDTIIFYVDLSSNKPSLPTSAVLLALLSCSAAISTLMALGHAIRGGIDVGRAGEIYENEIYGPALNCAYLLESEKAGFPRVLIGDGLQGYLQALKNTKESDFSSSTLAENLKCADYLTFGSELQKRGPEALRKYITILKKEADLCSQFISKDSDGHFSLDYFGKFVSNLLSGQEFGELFIKACDFSKNEKERFGKIDDKVLYERYSRLCDYLDSRASFWK